MAGGKDEKDIQRCWLCTYPGNLEEKVRVVSYWPT